jgi:glycosyltransferase involved in cell wall biosynthesis/GT2 family glycosyltransferase
LRILRIFHSAVVSSWRERERALRRLGVDVELVSAVSWNEGGSVCTFVPDGDTFVRPARTWGRHPALFVYDPRVLWHALGEQWDLVDIHEEPFALATAEVLLIRWLRRQRAPYTVYSAQNLTKRYPLPFRRLERRVLRSASGASVCNTAAGDVLVAKGLPAVPRLIPLGIDTRHFTPTPTARPPARDECLTVGYVGRLEPHKGVHLLLEAVGLSRRLRLRIAGSGSSEADLREQVRRTGLTDRVQFLGPVSQEDLPAFYTSLDVLAVPSRQTPSWVEQFGRVAVEAMGCGTPVVASRTGALPDVVGDAGRLVPPDDAPSLARALEDVAQQARTSSVLREAAVRRSAGCSWDAVAASYQRMYETATHASDRTGVPAGVEVVVVAYGAPELLRRSLEPLGGLTVTVVDNSSSSAVREVCRELEVGYLDPGCNGGFASGVNHALARRQLPHADVLLLNPDAVVSTRDLDLLRTALRADPRLASVAPSQVDGDGSPARVTWPFPGPVRACADAVGLGRLDRRTGFVIGSVLLLRAEALAQVGGFDERFFLYAEETDWAFRAARLGWRHREVPEAVAVHLGAGTSRDSLRRTLHFHASQERYLRKHFGPVRWQVARLAQLAGSSARGVVLAGGRGRDARERAGIYLTGPVEAERRYLTSRGEPAVDDRARAC